MQTAKCLFAECRKKALGKDSFCRVPKNGTRQNTSLPSARKKALAECRKMALGKVHLKCQSLVKRLVCTVRSPITDLQYMQRETFFHGSTVHAETCSSAKQRRVLESVFFNSQERNETYVFLSSDARTNAASVLLMYVTRDDCNNHFPLIYSVRNYSWTVVEAENQ